MSSPLRCVAFLAMLAVARNLGARAQADGVPMPSPPAVLLAVAVLLLLADFGFLVAGRVVEATTARVAVFAVLLWLIDRGTFLGVRHNGRRTFALGALAGLAVGFGYIYSAFLIPGVIVPRAWWGWQGAGHSPCRSPRGARVRQGASRHWPAYSHLRLPCLRATARWSGTGGGCRDTRRPGWRRHRPGPALGAVPGNTFRLDRPLMAVVLVRPIIRAGGSSEAATGWAWPSWPSAWHSSPSARSSPTTRSARCSLLSARPAGPVAADAADASAARRQLRTPPPPLWRAWPLGRRSGCWWRPPAEHAGAPAPLTFSLHPADPPPPGRDREASSRLPRCGAASSSPQRLPPPATSRTADPGACGGRISAVHRRRGGRCWLLVAARRWARPRLVVAFAGAILVGASGSARRAGRPLRSPRRDDLPDVDAARSRHSSPAANP